MQSLAAVLPSATALASSSQARLMNEISFCFTKNGDENSIINWIYDGDILKTGDDDDIVTVEDVKRKMEMLHLNR